MLAKTPPMGFNTWNPFGSEINEALIHAGQNIFAIRLPSGLWPIMKSSQTA